MNHYLIKTIKHYFIVFIVHCTSIAFGQNVLEYENASINLNASFEIPSLENIQQKKEIYQNAAIFFNNRTKKYEQYLKSNPSTKLPVSLTFDIDTVYFYTKYMIFVYNVHEENIPIYNTSHWMETLVFNLEDGKQYHLNLCDFLNCKSPIPLHKVVNNKIQFEACKLIEDDGFHVKHFVPKQNNKFLIFVWSQLGKNPDKCKSNYEVMQIEFTKEELVILVNGNNPTRSISSPKAYIYSSINTPVRTNMYLIKGDKVEILTELNQWLKIRFRGKRTIEGWIKKDDTR